MTEPGALNALLHALAVLAGTFGILAVLLWILWWTNPFRDGDR